MLNVSNISHLELLEAQSKLILIIFDIAGKSNVIKLPNLKKKIGEALGVAPQTVGRHLAVLVESGIIKYKYSGIIFLNPDVFSVADNVDALRREYSNFRSDM